MAATFIPIPYKERLSFILSQFSSATVIPDAIPTIPVCIPALYALLQTSELLTTTDGADAVGGVLSVTTVEDTVVLVSAPNTMKGVRHNISSKKNFFILLSLIYSIYKKSMI